MQTIPWLVLRAELLGTAALVLVGLSLVILMFGDGSPIPGVLPSEGWRRLITGFLFGTTGALIALSPVGERSGAHINPIVTLAFRLMGKLDLPTSLGYVVAQLAGAILGSLPLLAWGAMGRSVAFGATFPGEGYSTRGRPARRSDHDVRHGHAVVRVPRLSPDSFVHPRDLSHPVRRDGVRRSRRSRARAPTRRAASDRRSFQDDGSGGGSIGSAR